MANQCIEPPRHPFGRCRARLRQALAIGISVGALGGTLGSLLLAALGFGGAVSSAVLALGIGLIGGVLSAWPNSARATSPAQAKRLAARRSDR